VVESAILSECARASIESRTADRAAGGDTEAGETIRRRRLSRKKTAHRRVVRFIRDPIGTRLKIIPRADALGRHTSSSSRGSVRWHRSR